MEVYRGKTQCKSHKSAPKRENRSGTAKDVEQVKLERLGAFASLGVNFVLHTSTYGLPSGIFCSRAYGGDIMCSFRLRELPTFYIQCTTEG